MNSTGIRKNKIYKALKSRLCFSTDNQWLWCVQIGKKIHHIIISSVSKCIQYFFIQAIDVTESTNYSKEERSYSVTRSNTSKF